MRGIVKQAPEDKRYGEINERLFVYSGRISPEQPHLKPRTSSSLPEKKYRAIPFPGICLDL